MDDLGGQFTNYKSDEETDWPKDVTSYVEVQRRTNLTGQNNILNIINFTNSEFILIRNMIIIFY